MISWVTDNMGTILAAAFVIVIAVSALIIILKDKKKGKSSCGCNCAHCSMAGTCHKSKQ